MAASFVVGALFWLVLVSSFQPQEMLAGAVCTAVTVAFMVFVAHQTQSPRRFPWRDVAEFWRVPGAILTDSVRITRVLLRSLLGGDTREAGYNTIDFVPAGAKAERDGRKVLAVLFTTAGPNTITLGVSDHQGCMMQHTLEPAPPSPTVRALAMETSRG